jgi:glycosyltransferase involved in cell wall biosynthesis
MLQETTQFTSPLQGKINFMVRPNISCDYHRVKLPAEYMGVDVNAPAPNAKIDVFCRTQEQPIEAYFSGPNRRPFIVDIDDFWYLYPQHYLHGIWNTGKIADKIILAMKEAGAVTVTNEILYDRVKVYNKKVHIIQNALPFDNGQFTKIDTSGKAVFFWAGGASHAGDLTVLRQVMTNTPFELVLMGDDGGGQWAKIRSLFAGRAKITKMLPVESYMSGYQGNVMLIPLENNFFNQHKSNLKVLEAGAKGMAVIASRMYPYYNEKDKPYIMYADTPAEWQSHIRYCMANPGFVQEMGAALAEHVRTEYSLRAANAARHAIYSGIIK